MINILREQADAPSVGSSPYIFTPGDRFIGALSADDVDRIGVSLKAGVTYDLVSLLGGEDLTSSELFVFAPDGAPLISNSFSRAIDRSTRFTPEQDGLHHIAISAGFGGTGPYEIRVRETLEETGDLPGDPSTTTRLPLDSSLSGRLSDADDRDWLKVRLGADQTYVFAVEGIGLVDPVLTLYDTSGARVAGADDGSGTFDPTLQFSTSTAATYFLEVSGASDLDQGGYFAKFGRADSLGTAASDRIQVDGAGFITGGDGDDTLIGDGAANGISGGKGDDRLIGAGKGDTLRGDQGDDRIIGGAGRDDLSGDRGNDLLKGGSGKDRLAGGEGSDTLKGGGGADTLNGGGVFEGDEAPDTLVGGAGADTFEISAGAGTDVIRDFDPAQDILSLDFDLNPEFFFPEDLLDRYARVENGDTILAFKFDTTVILRGVTDLEALADALL